MLLMLQTPPLAGAGVKQTVANLSTCWKVILLAVVVCCDSERWLASVALQMRR